MAEMAVETISRRMRRLARRMDALKRHTRIHGKDTIDTLIRHHRQFEAMPTSQTRDKFERACLYLEMVDLDRRSHAWDNYKPRLVEYHVLERKLLELTGGSPDQYKDLERRILTAAAVPIAISVSRLRISRRHLVLDAKL